MVPPFLSPISSQQATTPEHTTGAASNQELATSVVEIPMNNSVYGVDIPWSERDRTCPECYEDETLSVQKKAFEYRDEGAFLNHLNGNFHTAGKKFERAAEGRHSENPDEGYICILCEQSEQDRLHHSKDDKVPTTKFPNLHRLMAHVRSSTADTDGRKHDELKALAGFYDPAPAPRKDSHTEIKAAQAREKDLKEMGIEVVKMRPAFGIDPYPHPHMPGLVRGMPPSDGIPAKFATSLQYGAPPVSVGIPLKFATSLQYGAPPTTSGIPSAFQNSLTLGSLPSGTVSTIKRTSAAPGPSQRSAPRPPPAVDPHACRDQLQTSFSRSTTISI
ncbi:hypothetical protein TI39_contig4319g00010 [Zymoseptoria brevis]|uniref:Uncharacterized protein n=1 Tax=Zymoseptoria brevis TaxID=1047168 RepID=A0A0F4G7Y2_9PEZI|nr:hypothetical protein TI39_contig4319g00010 [Zymoseptoria brevis]